MGNITLTRSFFLLQAVVRVKQNSVFIQSNAAYVQNTLNCRNVAFDISRFPIGLNQVSNKKCQMLFPSLWFSIELQVKLLNNLHTTK